MRDLIWTIIGIWVVWKIYNTIKEFTKAKNQSAQYNQKREGKVTIENASQQKSHFKSDDGEYVDYEEIK